MHAFRQFYEGIYMPVLFSTHPKSVIVLSAPINGPPPISLFQCGQFSRPHCQYEFSCLHCKSSFSLYFDLFSIQCPVVQWFYYSSWILPLQIQVVFLGLLHRAVLLCFSIFKYLHIHNHHCTQQRKSPLVSSTGPLETSVSYVMICCTHTHTKYSESIVHLAEIDVFYIIIK